MAPRNRRLLLPLLVLLLLLAGAVHSASNDRRASTLFHPAAAFLAPITSPCSSPSTAGNKEPQAPPAVQVAVDKPLPLTRRCRRPSSRRNALPPFDTPLDPAAIEAMVQQAAQQAQQTPVPQGMGEVTTEQLWVGFVAGVFPFVWAGYEFWKRIDTQQRCGVCQGSGLVYESRSGRQLEVPRKCFACGGFLPWMGWRRFWLSNLDIGNGGILQRPAADYEALSAEAKQRRQQQQEGQE